MPGGCEKEGEETEELGVNIYGTLQELWGSLL